MQKQTIRDLDLRGRRVLLRTDYNVQVDEDGVIVDDLRLRESLPTLRMLRDGGARVIVCSHRGRPRGEVVEDLRNEPVAHRLGELLGCEVRSIQTCVGPEAEAAAAALAPGEVLMLENIRFEPGEEGNDPAFARQLAALADVYVNDAFGTAHRAHASIVGVAALLPAVGGLLLEREVDYLEQVTEQPDRPLGLLLGGAKVADKIGIVEHLLDHADVICVGGAIASTFLVARGFDVADSLIDRAGIDPAERILAEVERRGAPQLVLPVDVVVAAGTAEAGGLVRTVPVGRVPTAWRIMDIGPATAHAFREALAPMRTIVWNGPMGLFEREPFDRGTMEVAFILAGSSGTTVVGGGETAAAVQRAGVADRISHVSTGGGASLAMLQGRPLPALDALLERGASLALDH